MLNCFKNKKVRGKRERGFTLIELLVVISIIGLLSSVVLASLNGARMKARDAKRLSDKHQIKLALELAYDSLGYYPKSFSWKCLAPTSETCWRNNSTGSDSVLTALAPYLSTVPSPNASGNNYATNAYLYTSYYPEGIGIGGVGAYLLWYQESEITTGKCNGRVDHYDTYWYCYEWIGPSSPD